MSVKRFSSKRTPLPSLKIMTSIDHTLKLLNKPWGIWTPMKICRMSRACCCMWIMIVRNYTTMINNLIRNWLRQLLVHLLLLWNRYFIWVADRNTLACASIVRKLWLVLIASCRWIWLIILGTEIIHNSFAIVFILELSIFHWQLFHDINVQLLIKHLQILTLI